jgi:hypothetical protein
LPGLPFSTPVTKDEILRNLIHDFGGISEGAVVPITMEDILLALDSGAYQTNLALFGSGIDGPVHFAANANGNANTGALWNGTTITASANVYTLTQDVWLGQTYANNAVTWPIIDAGVTINSNGFRIFCQGLLQNNGTISSNGTAAAGTTAGTLLSYTGTLSSSTVGTAGGTGATSSNNAGTNVGTTGLGGAGGVGGANGGATAGGAGGTVTKPGATSQLPFSLPMAVIGKTQTTTTLVAMGAGGGGGSGQGDGGNNSGAGGGGAGIVVVCAQRLAGTGTIAAVGGAGSAAAAAGNSGGGAGGGGGIVTVITRNVQTLSQQSAANVFGQTITAAGGAGGAGFGTGVAGASGNSGTVILIPA